MRQSRCQRDRFARGQPSRRAALCRGHPHAEPRPATGPCRGLTETIPRRPRGVVGIAGMHQLLDRQRRPKPRRRQPHAGRAPFPLHRRAAPRLYPNRKCQGVHDVGAARGESRRGITWARRLLPAEDKDSRPRQTQAAYHRPRVGPRRNPSR